MNSELHYYNLTPKYYINMDSSPERKAHMEAHMPADFQRFTAFDGNKASYDQMIEEFDMEEEKRLNWTTLTKNQMSCAISHWKLSKKIIFDPHIDPDQFVLICEDDIMVVDEFEYKLNELLEQLYTPEYSNCEVVILNFLNFNKSVDFSECLKIIDKQHPCICPGTPEFDEYAKSKGFNPNPEDLDELSSRLYYRYVRAKYKHIKSFTYNNLPSYNSKTSIDSNLEIKVKPIHQHLIIPRFFHNYAANCTLVRKRLLMKQYAKNPRIYWHPDQYHALCPVTSILIATPNLAYAHQETADNSTISHNNISKYESLIWHLTAGYFDKVNNNYDYYSDWVLQLFSFLIPWKYSKSSILRATSKILHKLLWLANRHNFYTPLRNNSNYWYPVISDNIEYVDPNKN